MSHNSRCAKNKRRHSCIAKSSLRTMKVRHCEVARFLTELEQVLVRCGILTASLQSTDLVIQCLAMPALLVVVIQVVIMILKVLKGTHQLGVMNALLALLDKLLAVIHHVHSKK